jgi:hypothetical protein
MDIIKNCLAASFLVLALFAISNTTVTAAAQTDSLQPIDSTVTHLDAALKAGNADDWDIAQEHMKAARQSAKDIIGGSLEVRAQRGANAIASARRLAQKDDKAGALASLKQAIEIFKSLQNSSDTGGRGGLK